MAIITKIESQKNKSRVNIFVDDSFFCGINKETAIVFGLKEKQEIDEVRLKAAVFESEVKSAFEKSLDTVGRRMHSKKELVDKLLKKGYSSEVCEKVIEKLEEYHYIDDVLFAKQFAASNAKISKRSLKEKLNLRGVSADIVLEIISERTNDDEFELCMVQAKKYLKSRKVESYQDLAKLQASLARKGFDYDIIKRVCKNLVVIDNEL